MKMVNGRQVIDTYGEQNSEPGRIALTELLTECANILGATVSEDSIALAGSLTVGTTAQVTGILTAAAAGSTVGDVVFTSSSNVAMTLSETAQRLFDIAAVGDAGSALSSYGASTNAATAVLRVNLGGTAHYMPLHTDAPS